MPIQIKNAGEHNLKDVSVEFGDGLTVVTGVSGSGKTSLVFDTLYHEANRRFLEIFSLGSAGTRLSPAKVGSISGLGPAVAVGQNLLNRNPASTLASASGLHPLLRLLYARFGERHCPHCASPLSVLSGDEIVERLVALSVQGDLTVSVPLLQNVKGCHATLLELLATQFDPEAVWVDNAPWHNQPLDGTLPHTITLEIARFSAVLSATQARQVLETSAGLGASTLQVSTPAGPLHLARSPVCVTCGAWFGDLEPVHFHTPCPHCAGKGCDACARTGLHPQAAAVTWCGMRLPELLALTVDQVLPFFIPSPA